MATVLQKPATDPGEGLNEPAEAVEPRAAAGVRVDTLAESVIVLLLLAGLQRIVGFTRGMLVCRWLGREELGQWDMAMGFITMAAPLAVLGLPGSFGRYVGYFSQRGQLQHLIRRTAGACFALTALAAAAIVAAQTPLSALVFGTSALGPLMVAVATTLVAVIAYNYLTELLTALRMARLTSVVQFIHSLLFAAFSLSLLWFWKTEAVSLIAAYGLACGLLTAGMLCYVRFNSSCLVPNGALLASADSLVAPGHGRFWPRLLSFAAWVWITNLLYNLFDVIDRYMIIHWSTASDPLAIVGDYHSSRILPLLLVSVSGLLGTIVLPHLSHDWEANRRELVSKRLNLALKLLGIFLFAGSVVILWAAPLLFGIAFEGKYAAGRTVLPWTLTYCCWFGTAMMAQMYLWCAERARLGCIALVAGLLVNVGLNLVLLPRLGLLGAVLATSAANAVALGILYRFNTAMGMQLDRSVLLLSSFPLLLPLGAVCGTIALAGTGILAIKYDFVLRTDEKQRLAAIVNQLLEKLGLRGDAYHA